MNKNLFLLALSVLSVVSIASCDTRESSKKITQKALDVVDGVSDALKEHGQETGEKATEGLQEVGKGVGKSLGTFLTENIDTLGKVAGEVIAKGGTALMEGATNALYPPVDFQNDENNEIEVSGMGASEAENRVFIFMDRQVGQDYLVQILCYNEENLQTELITGKLPASSQYCELLLKPEEMKRFITASRRLVSMKLMEGE